MEHEALAQRELREYLMQDPDFRRLNELQLKASLYPKIKLYSTLTI